VDTSCAVTTAPRCRSPTTPVAIGTVRSARVQLPSSGSPSDQAELLPVEYYHLVFTLPAPISDIAYQNKAAIYDLLFQATAETLRAIATDPKHLGARIGFTAVLHTWGSAMTHHPHLHCILPGGGLSADGEQWTPCKRGFFLPVRVLSRLFRRLFLEQLSAAHRTGRLEFFAQHQHLTDAGAFADFLRPLRQIEWVVYAKRPFSGPAAVLAYLSRYTHRVAISNSRLIAHDDQGVTFTWKDYRAKSAKRYKRMRLTNEEFIRRFLLHVLPTGFHRIRHFGLFANYQRASALQQIRTLLLDDADHTAAASEALNANDIPHNTYVCPACGAPMTVIETIERVHTPRAPPS